MTGGVPMKISGWQHGLLLSNTPLESVEISTEFLEEVRWTEVQLEESNSSMEDHECGR